MEHLKKAESEEETEFDREGLESVEEECLSLTATTSGPASTRLLKSSK